MIKKVKQRTGDEQKCEDLQYNKRKKGRVRKYTSGEMTSERTETELDLASNIIGEVDNAIEMK